MKVAAINLLISLLIACGSSLTAQGNPYEVSESTPFREGTIPGYQTLRVDSKVARVQSFTAESSQPVALHMLSVAGESPLHVDIRSVDLERRYGWGMIKGSTKELAWHAVEWDVHPELEPEETYAIVVVGSGYDPWGVVRSKTDVYPWGEATGFQHTPSAINLQRDGYSISGAIPAARLVDGFDLAYRMQFADGSVIDSEIMTSEIAPPLFDGASFRGGPTRVNGNGNILPVCSQYLCRAPLHPAYERAMAEKPEFDPYDSPAGERISRTANSRYLVKVEDEALNVLDTGTMTTQSIPIARGLSNRLLEHWVVVAPGSRREPTYGYARGNYIVIDLRNGARVKKSLEVCEYEYPTTYDSTLWIMCFQDDLLTLHDVNSERVITPPPTPEFDRMAPPFWVGDELYFLGRVHRYAWSPGQSSWQKLGATVHLRRDPPSQAWASLLTEIHKKDPNHPGFVDGIYYHRKRWFYNVQKDQFLKLEVKGTGHFSDDIVRYGSWVLHPPTGEFRLARLYSSTNWVGEHAIILPENCPEGATCTPLPEPFSTHSVLRVDPSQLKATPTKKPTPISPDQTK